MVATASTEHPFSCKQQPIGCSVEAVATMIGCLPTEAQFPSKRNARNASDCVWMETGLYTILTLFPVVGSKCFWMCHNVSFSLCLLSCLLRSPARPAGSHWVLCRTYGYWRQRSAIWSMIAWLVCHQFCHDWSDHTRSDRDNTINEHRTIQAGTQQQAGAESVSKFRCWP